MSPIVLRPIREQFEHNRMIRLLQIRLRRKYAVDINIEDEREATGVRSGTDLVYPDLVLTSTTGPRRLHGVAEVETAESVNHLEAMAEWVHLGHVRGAFYLYVPTGTTDIARNLCERHGIGVTEIWSYHAVGDQMRLTMTYRSTRASLRAASRRVNKAAKRTVKPAKTAKRASKVAKRGTKAGKRATKTAKRATKTARRATKVAKRATKTAKRTPKTGTRSARSAATTAGRKTTRAASRSVKKPAKGAKRRAVSGGKRSSRASASASKSRAKTRRKSTAARTRKTAPPRRMRKQR